jgi:uncharacterized membrane protein YphA (DoxX/SURF4 family)
VAIVILRLMIGLHFLSEGTAKLGGEFSSSGFLSNAKGPLAPSFRAMVWDAEGRSRLGMAHNKQGDLVIQGQPTRNAWRDYRADVADYYGFDKQQQKESEKLLSSYLAQYDWYVKTNRDETLEYFKQLERREGQRQDATYTNVASLREQGEKLEGKLRRDRAGLLVGIDKMWEGLEDDMNGLATPDQRGNSSLALHKLGRQTVDSITLDKVIPYFDLVVGACLVLGLLVRWVSAFAGLFLISVIASQWPGAVGAAPVYYQVIELAGLGVLAMMAAGQYAGLDFFIQYKRRQRASKKEKAAGQVAQDPLATGPVSSELQVMEEIVAVDASPPQPIPLPEPEPEPEPIPLPEPEPEPEPDPDLQDDASLDRRDE